MTANQELPTQAADILVADDSIASLRMLTEILTKAGYRPRPVEDPQLALEAALAQPPSLILLDVRMPNMSGFELCRRLKQEERTCDVPVIFVSALEEVQDRIQGFEVGGVDFVTKPIQEAEVLARVQTHLQLRNTQLHLEGLVAERTAELEKLLAERSVALDSAEDQIRILFESAQVGIGITTPEGEILSVNQALLGMTGYTEAEIQQLNVQALYSEPDLRALLLERLQESEAVQEFGAQILRKDGTFFYASLNVSRLVREGQEVLLALVEDVTERVKAEQLLEQSGAQAERDRLAQDLHDSVTQGLYSASLIAETLPWVWEEEPEEARRGLQQLERLTQGALAEMRALLLELRPAALVDQELPVLLRQLADAAMARTRAVVTTTVAGDCSLPTEVKIAMYRITQEALNNVVKHAQARQAWINLNCDGPKLSLRIGDNGVGFDPEGVVSKGLGLGTMRERADGIDATLTITGQPDQGTEVLAEWSAS